jgi:hypothetical protein
VLHQVGHPGRAWKLVSPPDAIPDHGGHDRGPILAEEEDLEPVRQEMLLDLPGDIRI